MKKNSLPGDRAGRRVRSFVSPLASDLDFNPDTDLTELRAHAHRARVGLHIAATLLVVAGVLAAVHVLIQSLVYRNPQFTLRAVHFDNPGGKLTEEELRRESGLTRGVELASVDLGKVRDNLLRLPRIETVSTERILPDKLKVMIKERKPVAWIQCTRLGLKAFSPETGYLIDQNGVPIKCESLYRDYMTLPVIEAQDIRGFSERVAVTEPSILVALELLIKSKKEFYKEQLAIRSIVVLNEWSMQALYRNGTRAVFGREDLDRQLQSLHSIVLGALENGWILQEVNVMPEQNIPVIFGNGPVREVVGEAKPSSPLNLVETSPDPVGRAHVSESAPASTTAPAQSVPVVPNMEKDVRAILGDLYP